MSYLNSTGSSLGLIWPGIIRRVVEVRTRDPMSANDASKTAKFLEMIFFGFLSSWSNAWLKLMGPVGEWGDGGTPSPLMPLTMPTRDPRRGLLEPEPGAGMFTFFRIVTLERRTPASATKDLPGHRIILRPLSATGLANFSIQTARSGPSPGSNENNEIPFSCSWIFEYSRKHEEDDAASYSHLLILVCILLQCNELSRRRYSPTGNPPPRLMCSIQIRDSDLRVSARDKSLSRASMYGSMLVPATWRWTPRPCHQTNKNDLGDKSDIKTNLDF